MGWLKEQSIYALPLKRDHSFIVPFLRSFDFFPTAHIKSLLCCQEAVCKLCFSIRSVAGNGIRRWSGYMGDQREGELRTDMR